MTVGEVTVIPKEKGCDVEWKIIFYKMDFPFLYREDEPCYLSPCFSFEGKSWQLLIWPNGRRCTGSAGYIDLRLYKTYFMGPPINVEFCFSLKTENGKNDFKRQKTVVLHEGSGYTMEQFISRSELKKRRSEFLTSGFLTVVCSLNMLNSTESANDNAKAACSYCKKTFYVNETSLHEKKCRIQCPDCCDIVVFQKWHDHECQISRTEECSYCKKNVVSENISKHEKKCMDRPIKCPECSEIVVLQQWHNHECRDSVAEDDSSLCEDFKEMLLNGSNHDIILRVSDKELRAHQNILRARSQVFNSMLSHDMKEKNSGIIEIPDCDPQAMEQFLCYLYTGKVDCLVASNMLTLYYIADKYDKKGLKEKCCAIIKKSMLITNICEVIQLALNHTDSKLLEHATEYFIDNAIDIMCTVEWQSFMKNNCTVANELTLKALKKFKNANNTTIM